MKDLDLLGLYMEWFIDRIIETTLDKRIEIYSTHRYIEYGRKREYLPNFSQWKLLKH